MSLVLLLLTTLEQLLHGIIQLSVAKTEIANLKDIKSSSVAFNNTGTILASGSCNTIKLWNIETKTELPIYKDLSCFIH